LGLKHDTKNLNQNLKGKIEIHSRVSLDTLYKDNNKILDLIYTTGVSFVAKEISRDIKLTYDYTSKWDNVAII